MVANYDEIMKLALERGFYFPSCEIYSDAPAGFWEYGPRGVNMKNKFIELWRRELVRRDGMLEIDGCQIMSKSVFVASGHIGNFTDPVVKCTKCGSSFRADRYITEKTGETVLERMAEQEIKALIKKHNLRCPNCNGEFGEVSKFNMMFPIGIGPAAEKAYLRPETCQTIFVDFARLFKTMRGRLPLGVAQVGKSFRNEIAPRQSLLRLREFYQAEIEVFCNPNRLNDMPKFEEVKNTVLRLSDGSSIIEVTAGEAINKGLTPNKLITYYLALLVEFYEKTGIDVKRCLAPILVGILPLMTKDGLDQKARQINSELKYDFDTFYDESGSIGRRYRRLEEIGTPFAVTVDNTTMQDDTVTVRHRDTMQQERINISDLHQYLHKALGRR